MKRKTKAQGRPTRYTPQIGDDILALMASGLTLTAAAAELGIYRQLAYDWRDRHPEFAEKLSLGQGLRQAFLERRLLAADAGPVVTSTIFALKNCNPEWRERSELELSGKNGGAIQFEDVTRDADAFASAMARLSAGANGGGTGETDTGSKGGA